MNAQLTKNFFDACYKAKHIIQYLPPLPEWMSPRQVTIIYVIHQLSQTQNIVRISDVAKALNGTMPSITRMIADLAAHDAVEKFSDATDRRVHFLKLTTYGESLYNYYIERFHLHFTSLLTIMANEDIHTAISVIEQAEALLRMDNTLYTIPKKKEEQ